VSFSSGTRVRFNVDKLNLLAVISTTLWIIALVFILKNDIPEVKKYANSEDDRMEYLKMFEDKFVPDTLLLKPLYLPTISEVNGKLLSLGQKSLSYILQPNEIKPAGQDFVNDCICRSLHLEFHVKLKSDSIKTNP